MTNPWMAVPLEDYEGHMAMPDVGQAGMLVSTLEKLILASSPSSVAIIGCAGGNGFSESAKLGVQRVVGVDINPNYIADARERHAGLAIDLELYCSDIEKDALAFQPVDMVYAALIFEYVDVAKALMNFRRICRPNGALAVVLQLPKKDTENVSPSPFTTLKTLSSIMKLVPPDHFRKVAEGLGFHFSSEDIVTLESGKQFALQVFKG